MRIVSGYLASIALALLISPPMTATAGEATIHSSFSELQPQIRKIALIPASVVLAETQEDADGQTKLARNTDKEGWTRAEVQLDAEALLKANGYIIDRSLIEAYDANKPGLATSYSNFIEGYAFATVGAAPSAGVADKRNVLPAAIADFSKTSRADAYLFVSLERGLGRGSDAGITAVRLLLGGGILGAFMGGSTESGIMEIALLDKTGTILWREVIPHPGVLHFALKNSLGKFPAANAVP